jgi:hypothetical protein
MAMSMRIEQHWNQVDGGIRLLVVTEEAAVTIDQAADRSLSGFVRPGFIGSRADEDVLLRRVFKFVKAAGYGPH